jgi:hypothetical protein
MQKALGRTAKNAILPRAKWWVIFCFTAMEQIFTLVFYGEMGKKRARQALEAVLLRKMLEITVPQRFAGFFCASTK